MKACLSQCAFVMHHLGLLCRNVDHACSHHHALQDRDEPTLELSLFAEAFQEMLVRDYGTQILNALYMERQAVSHAQHHHALIYACSPPH